MFYERAHEKSCALYAMISTYFIKYFELTVNINYVNIVLSIT
jgi:hypothetical protein